MKPADPNDLLKIILNQAKQIERSSSPPFISPPYNPRKQKAKNSLEKSSEQTLYAMKPFPYESSDRATIPSPKGRPSGLDRLLSSSFFRTKKAEIDRCPPSRPPYEGFVSGLASTIKGENVRRKQPELRAASNAKPPFVASEPALSGFDIVAGIKGFNRAHSKVSKLIYE